MYYAKYKRRRGTFSNFILDDPSRIDYFSSVLQVGVPN